jgi:glycosyltransferase involved in cell wall biosynthesis
VTASLHVVFPVPALTYGGAEQQLLELVRALDKSRVRPIVAPLHPGGPLEGEFRAIPGAEVVPLFRRNKWDLTPITKLSALLRARRAEVVQPYLPPATTFGLLAGILARTPVKILTERSGVGREMSFYIRVQDQLTRFADCVVTNSAAGRQSLIQRGTPEERVRVIVNGINLERLAVERAAIAEVRARTRVPEGGFVVGILASLLPVKLHDVFLRAAAIVGAHRSNARYAIFGDGPLRGDLERLAAELGIADQVVFFGYRHDVANCLAACDLLVSTSRVEGLSNAILEAMALGVSVVASDIPGNRELVEDEVTGYLVPVGDDLALASRLERAFDHPEETRSCAERARRMIAARFSVQRMAEEHLALYESLLLAKSRRVVAVGA